MSDGIIILGSHAGRTLGFTPAKFNAGSYLWKTGDSVYISLISAKHPGCGDFRRLVAKIHSLGLTVKVPTPMPRMLAILQKNGYTMTLEDFQDQDGDSLPDKVEVWSLQPNGKRV